MHAVKTHSIKKPVVFLKYYQEDDTLLVIDDETTVQFLDNESFKIKSGFKAGIKHEYYKNNVVVYSNNKLFLATLSQDRKESRLYNTTTKKMVAKVSRHHGEVACIAIDPKDRYMFSGGDDGKIFGIDVKTGKLALTLPAHVDTINDIEFSKNGNWIAVASFDRKVSIYNLASMNPNKEKLTGHTAAVMKTKFFGKDKLLSVDKDAKAIIWNIYTNQIVARLQGIHDEVNHVVISDDERFLFLGTNLGYVLLYDLKTYELISERFVKFTSPITYMIFDGQKNHLIIGTQDGFLAYYDIFDGYDNFKKMLQNQQFKEVNSEIARNPLLKYTDIYDLMTNLWDRSFAKAQAALEAGDKNKAELLLKQFKNVPAKNKLIQKLYQDFQQYPRFVEMAKSGKFSLAYSLANSVPVYKETKIYKALEKQWKKTFAQAQKLMLDPKTSQQAKELLVPYRGISEKTKLIQELMTQHGVYKLLRDTLAKKDLKKALQFVERYQFLKELPEYFILLDLGIEYYKKAQDALKNEKFEDALEYFHILKDFDDFKEEALEKFDEIQMRKKFKRALESKQYHEAYDAMASLEELEETPVGKKLQAKWYEDIQNANSFALRGNMVGVHRSLKKYFKTHSKRMAIATIVSLCYISQLERSYSIENAEKKIEKGLRKYISYFGITEHIESFFEIFIKRFPDSKLELETMKQGSFEFWRPSMIVKSILE